MKKKLIVLLSLTAVFIFFMFSKTFAQESDVEKQIDEIVAQAKKGDKEAKQYLFFLAAMEIKGAQYLLKAAKENKNDVYFQSLFSICSFMTDNKEIGLKNAEELAGNTEFGGMDKYSLAAYLCIEGRQSNEERCFKIALKMFEDLKKAKFDEMDNVYEYMAICVPETPERSKFMKNLQ